MEENMEEGQTQKGIVIAILSSVFNELVNISAFVLAIPALMCKLCKDDEEDAFFFHLWFVQQDRWLTFCQFAIKHLQAEGIYNIILYIKYFMQ